MTIQSAIERSRDIPWNEEEIVVNVGFEVNGYEDETQFELYSLSKKEELEELWESLYSEFEADINSVSYIEFVE